MPHFKILYIILLDYIALMCTSVQCSIAEEGEANFIYAIKLSNNGTIYVSEMCWSKSIKQQKVEILKWCTSTSKLYNT